VLPYLLGAESALASTVVAALTLFLAGVLASRFTDRPWWFSGVRQLAFGMLAAWVTYGVGAAFHVSSG
jgi:VIT1/CCC1 family predicted Fe2+/Mn2+ transporter